MYPIGWKIHKIGCCVADFRRFQSLIQYSSVSQELRQIGLHLVMSLIPIWIKGFFPQSLIHTGSYMSAHVLWNLLNELRKRDRM